jgi:hypothetical protein
MKADQQVDSDTNHSFLAKQGVTGFNDYYIPINEFAKSRYSGPIKPSGECSPLTCK